MSKEHSYGSCQFGYEDRRNKKLLRFTLAATALVTAGYALLEKDNGINMEIHTGDSTTTIRIGQSVSHPEEIGIYTMYEECSPKTPIENCPSKSWVSKLEIPNPAK